MHSPAPESTALPNFRPGYAELRTSRRDDVHARLASILPATRSHFVWEVGCGHGHFLTAYAAAHPDKLCIGIDLVGERVERAEKKRARAKLANLHFIRAEARLFLEALPPAARATEIFILFPDPWPKSRHHKHRVLQPDFLAAAAAHAAPGCQLHFRTDYPPYFADATAAVEKSPCWHLADVPWPFEHETVFQSRAERHESFVARKRIV